MTSVSDFARMLAQNDNDKDYIKTQFGSADVSAYFKFFTDQVDPTDRGIRIKQRSLSGDTLIWGNSFFGTWNSQNWGNTAQSSFILGHTSAGVLGTSKLGITASDYITLRVVHPGRRYVDNLYDNFFADTANTTATWGTTGTIALTNSQVAQSLSVYLNNETVGTATLRATDGGSVSYLMSADGGSNFEAVTSGVAHLFANPGNDLRWKATASDTTSISYMEVRY